MKQNLLHFDNVLRNILIPRVPGSEGHKIVRNVILTISYKFWPAWPTKNLLTLIQLNANHCSSLEDSQRKFNGTDNFQYISGFMQSTLRYVTNYCFYLLKWNFFSSQYIVTKMQELGWTVELNSFVVPRCQFCQHFTCSFFEKWFLYLFV